MPILLFSQDPCPDCDLACITCASIDGYQNDTESSNAGSSLGTHCTATEHAITWLGFIAGSTDLSIEACALNCYSGSRFEIVIVEAIDCSDAAAVSNCYGFTSAIRQGECETLTNTVPLVVGQYYWLVFDNTNGTGYCEFSISVTSGMTGAVNLDAPEIMGEDVLCDGDTESYGLEDYFGVSEIVWTIDGDEVGSGNDYTFSESDPGVYTLCAQASNYCFGPEIGCKEVFVGESYDETFFFEICQEEDCVEFEGELYCWEGEDIAIEEETWLGCDSIIRLDITYLNPDNEIDLDSFEICEGEIFDVTFEDIFVDNEYDIIVGDDEYLESGDYMITVEDEDYCAYYIEFQLNVYDADTLMIHDSYCENGFYMFGGNELTEPGMYFDTLANAFGCDSINILVLEEIPKRDTIFSRVICRNEELFIAGEEITSPGFYSISTTSSLGCDSLIEATIDIADAISVDLTETICAGDSVFFAGDYYKESVSLENQSVTDSGCDSLTRFFLEVNEISETYISETICAGDSIFAGGEVLKAADNYSFFLSNQNNCDSLVSVDLAVNPVYAFEETIIMCKGDSFVFRGIVYKESIVSTHNFFSVDGCDSIITLDIEVLDDFYQETQKAICEGETYLFGNQSYSESGTYRYQETNVQGCDSVAVLELEVYPVDTLMLESNICAGDSVLFDNSYIKETGIYEVKYSSFFNCDSLVILDLLVSDEILVSRQDTFCERQEVIFGTQVITSSGLYEEVNVSVGGCDSITTLEAIFEPCNLAGGSVYRAISCAGADDGEILVKVESFFPPLKILLEDENGDVLVEETFSSVEEYLIDGLPGGVYDVVVSDLYSSATYEVLIREPDPITSQSTLSDYNGFNVSCEGISDGQIELSVIGGTEPYFSIIWDDGAYGTDREELAAGMYTYTVTDANLCTHENSIVIDAPDALTVDFQLTLDPCEIGNTLLELESGGGVEPYSITYLDQDNREVDAGALSEGNYSVIVRDANLCEEQIFFEIPRNNPSDLDLGPDLSVILGQEVMIDVMSSLNIVEYNWELVPEVSSLCTQCSTLSFTALEDQYSVLLEAFDENGCLHTDNLIVNVEKPLRVYIPNIISLDDPENNTLKIFGSDSIRVLDFKIYSKWGELIFQDSPATKTQSLIWDGTKNGKYIEQGVYVYFIRYEDQNGELVIETDDVTVIR